VCQLSTLGVYMKLLFTSMNRTDVGMLCSIIEEAGIEFEIRNDATNTNFPTGPFYPELWVIHDEDFAKAVELRDSWRATPLIEQHPWICPECAEMLEAQFNSCWKCGAVRKDTNAG
jgi:hypothetical protein